MPHPKSPHNHRVVTPRNWEKWWGRFGEDMPWDLTRYPAGILTAIGIGSIILQTWQHTVWPAFAVALTVGAVGLAKTSQPHSSQHLRDRITSASSNQLPHEVFEKTLNRASKRLDRWLSLWATMSVGAAVAYSVGAQWLLNLTSPGISHVAAVAVTSLCLLVNSIAAFASRDSFTNKVVATAKWELKDATEKHSAASEGPKPEVVAQPEAARPAVQAAVHSGSQPTTTPPHRSSWVAGAGRAAKNFVFGPPDPSPPGLPTAGGHDRKDPVRPNDPGR